MEKVMDCIGEAGQGARFMLARVIQMICPSVIQPLNHGESVAVEEVESEREDLTCYRKFCEKRNKRKEWMEL